MVQPLEKRNARSPSRIERPGAERPCAALAMSKRAETAINQGATSRGTSRAAAQARIARPMPTERWPSAVTQAVAEDGSGAGSNLSTLLRRAPTEAIRGRRSLRRIDRRSSKDPRREGHLPESPVIDRTAGRIAVDHEMWPRRRAKRSRPL